MPGAPLHAHLSHQMVNFVDPNVFETANAGFAQAMYEEFLRDPADRGGRLIRVQLEHDRRSYHARREIVNGP